MKQRATPMKQNAQKKESDEEGIIGELLMSILVSRILL
jgi:hypothetical protein